MGREPLSSAGPKPPHTPAGEDAALPSPGFEPGRAMSRAPDRPKRGLCLEVVPMRKLGTAVTVSALALGLVSSIAWAGSIRPQGAGNGELAPTGKGWGVHAPDGNAKPGGGGAGNGIVYHGGPVMSAGANIHYIWYQCAQAWSAGDQSILDNLASNLGGSPYFNINTTYTDANGIALPNQVSKAADVTDNCSKGNALTDTNIQQIVAAQNPTDLNGIYLVVTQQDVNATSGFCTQYCGWHTHASIGGRDIKYGFIGNPARCPSSCANGTTPPNGSVGADGAASIIAHEVEEAFTDPDLNAWYDNRGAENADKCAWTFGSTYSNGTGTA